MKTRALFLLSVVIFGQFVVGCIRAKDEPSMGRCYEHSDCKEGEKCNNGWCEDIYHPNGKIKQGL